ncbi:MAG: hypothetical protein KDD38_11800 [Bdellovibrionales bacterium]|nr:hypothetical protein [Bdellovibrionales bacterium]
MINNFSANGEVQHRVVFFSKFQIMPKEDLTLDKFVENKDEYPKLI